MLAIEKLNQFYGESHTLWDLDLGVPAGQCTCVMGRNGVGKTTLMKAIMGEVAVKSGQLRYQGDGSEIELTKKAVEARSRMGIGFVPQGRQIFPLLTVEENLRTGPGRPGRRAEKKPRAYLRAVSGAERDEAPPGRRFIRRATAAARHRPRAGDRA
ncbi:ATP-binding cassette domain-containing protein [Vreelandella lionensis]|uniref:ATP-binding cassette domain-containing protein n=1 Tax=Vreelandella lionensis TaxID=1144478 RepID=UPI0030F3B74B